jgi:hypothetical protein
VTGEPPSRGVRPNGMGSPLGRAGPWLAALAVAGPLTAGCASEAGGDRTGEASCAAVVVYQGHSYYGFGDLKRNPATTDRRVTGTVPSCDDSGGQEPVEPEQVVEVAELAEVPLETAFLWNGSIFIREGGELPAAKRTFWFRAPDCATAGRFQIVADW